MEEQLTEKFLAGFAIDVATTINKAFAITIIAGIYALEVSISLALVIAFSFSVLTIRFKKEQGLLTWEDVFTSTVHLLLMPWIFVLTSWVASFLI